MASGAEKNLNPRAGGPDPSSNSSSTRKEKEKIDANKVVDPVASILASTTIASIHLQVRTFLSGLLEEDTQSQYSIRLMNVPIVVGESKTKEVHAEAMVAIKEVRKQTAAKSIKIIKDYYTKTSQTYTVLFKHYRFTTSSLVITASC
jgi:hypothetical protein